MTPAEYRAIQAINASAIKAGMRSMLHMHHVLTGGAREQTTAMSHGTAVHALLFQPDAVVVWPSRRASKEWDAFEAGNADRIILSATEHAKASEAVKAITSNVHAADLLNDCRFETPIEWAMPDGTKCKALVDAWKPGLVVDLKTTKAIDERAFSRSSWDAGTHLQMAWYCMATGAEAAWIIAQESSAPWDVAVYPVDPLLLEHGERECLRIVGEYNRCLERGVFPGQQPEPRTLRQPSYADEIVQQPPDEEMDPADF